MAAPSQLLGPRVILPLLAVVLAAAVLFTPRGEVPDAEPRLTTYSSHSNGALGLYETLRRLGRRVERRVEPFRAPLDSNVTYALLAPPIEPTSGEVHALLTAVRAGAGLLVVPRPSTPLADSLGLRQSRRSFYQEVADSAGLYGRIEAAGDACASRVARRPVGTRYLLRTIERARGSAAAEHIVFVAVRGPDSDSSGALPAAAGYRLGRGRVVAVADPNMLRNDVVRLCEEPMGVLAVRMVEWLGGGRGRPDGPVVFDEYHHGRGRHPSAARVIWLALRDTPAGRAALQLAVAGLVLLLATGVRPIGPRARERIERRSPLEHVGALARAYEQVGATRRATRLLVRGLRRRHAVGALREAGDEEFLRALGERHRPLAVDADLLADAMRRPRAPGEFLAVGRAIAHIEETLTRAHGRTVAGVAGAQR